VQQAIASCEQAIMVAQALGDRHTESIVLNNLALTYAKAAKVAQAISASKRALDLAQAVGDWRVEAVALTTLCSAYVELGDAVAANGAGTNALEVVRKVGDRRQEGHALSTLGRVAEMLGDIPRAAAVFEQALAILHEVGDRSGIAASSWHFGLMLARQEERERAVEFLHACVLYEQEIGHMHAADHAALLAHVAAGGDVSTERSPAVMHRVLERGKGETEPSRNP
jgi:tetratricopeptide (TPR) repeat protein